jgi:hypothetical protein
LIEYLYNAIRATAGEEITIAAEITDINGIPILKGCHLNLYSDKERLTTINGELDEFGVWQFTIPAEVTANLTGRYWYCMCSENHNTFNFKQPLYLI